MIIIVKHDTIIVYAISMFKQNLVIIIYTLFAYEIEFRLNDEIFSFQKKV